VIHDAATANGLARRPFRVSPTSQVDQKPQTPQIALFAVGALTLALWQQMGSRRALHVAFRVMSVTLAGTPALSSLTLTTDMPFRSTFNALPVSGLR
jgi:hypothetical protein